jgi:hypothetical protein
MRVILNVNFWDVTPLVEDAVALELELTGAISFVGEALLTGKMVGEEEGGAV